MIEVLSKIEIKELKDREDGRIAGIEEGIEKGRIVGKVELLYNEMNLSVTEISKKLDMSEGEVKAIINRLKM